MNTKTQKSAKTHKSKTMRKMKGNDMKTQNGIIKRFEEITKDLDKTIYLRYDFTSNV